MAVLFKRGEKVESWKLKDESGKLYSPLPGWSAEKNSFRLFVYHIQNGVVYFVHDIIWKFRDKIFKAHSV